MSTLSKAGRYEIIGELGRGAMGVVYKAMDPVIGRTVAVKTIKLNAEGTGLSRPELLTRFQTEARAAGLLAHPNIVVVFDAGEEDGLYYITMELVEGKSLQALLDAGHAFPLPRVLRIMEQTCSALQFAHERNIVHRDIKPANLMLTADDTVKVTDFGTAKILQFGTVQQTAHVMGTPSYMSPEQVKGRAVDGRSDIFSLGVMLYEMVTGEKPFPGQNITTVIYKIVNEEPVPPRQLNPSVHPGISRVVMRALEKDPETRYQSCREMLEDLRNYRALSNEGGNPNATMVSGIAPGGLLGMRGNAGRDVRDDGDPLMATIRSLESRTTHPMQTPLVRRTGTLAPIEEPKKKNLVGTIFAAAVLLGVIGYGVIKLRPVYEDVRQHHDVAAVSANEATREGANPLAANGSGNAPIAEETKANSDATADEAKSGSLPVASPPAVAQPAVTDTKLVESRPDRMVSKKADSGVNSAAAEYKTRVESLIAERGLSGRAKIQEVGNTLILGGKLRPEEHGALLKFLHDAPTSVRVVDHIEDKGSAEAPPRANPPAGGSYPVPSAGDGAIHVVADVAGAIAILHGPTGQVVSQCQTPCNFNNIVPERYSLEVKKDGYLSAQTALQVTSGSVLDQKMSLESVRKGLFVNSEPAGADVFINGAKQSGQTPVTLPLAPGQYNIVLRLQGYEAYADTVQVRENTQTQLDEKLAQRSMDHIAFAQVETEPAGAEIFVDGTPTGKFTPTRLELNAGMHNITLKLAGFQGVKRTIQVSEGGSVTVQEALKPK